MPPQKTVRDRYIAAAAGDYRLGVNFLPSDEAKVKAWKKTPILGEVFGYKKGMIPLGLGCVVSFK